MAKKRLRFHKWKWALYTYELEIQAGGTKEEAMKQVITTMPTFAGNWMDRFEGKTKFQMEREGYACLDGWCVEE